MKKSLLLIIFFAIALTDTKAQSYEPMLDSINHWTFVSNVIPVVERTTPCGFIFNSSYAVYNTAGDTTMNGMVYKELIWSGLNSNTCTLGYIREDVANEKVYYMDDQFNPEILLYDFNLAVGDTINLPLQGFYFNPGVYTVDSIIPHPVTAGIRDFYYLHQNHAGNTLVWIEGVGYPGDLLYSLPSFQSPGWFQNCLFNNEPWVDYAQALTCFEHADKVYFDSCIYNEALNNFCFNHIDSCTFYNICGGLNDLKSVSSIVLSPNPAHDITTLQIDAVKRENCNVYIHDVKGTSQILQENITLNGGKQNFPLSLPKLAAGAYFIELRSVNGSIFSKLLIN